MTGAQRLAQIIAIRSILFAWLVPHIILTSCGQSDEESHCHAGPAYLVGEYSQEELDAVILVENAMVKAGYGYTGYAVNFVHSPDAPFKGTTWSKYRTHGIQPRDGQEGYRGYCDRKWCMIFVRRYGKARPHLIPLLRHELVHALGYDHGPAMQQVEQEIQEYLP